MPKKNSHSFSEWILLWVSFYHKTVSWISFKKFTCIGENTDKYITFTVSIEKEVSRIDKNGEEVTKKMSYILQFIDSKRFMVSSLWNLVNNLFQGIHKIECKYRHDDKNV